MEKAPRKPRLALFGAGPAGQAFARQFALLPFEVEAYDDRGAMTAHAAILPADELVALAACLEPGDFAVIASSSHELDFRLAGAVLRAGAARYCGMIGSRRKTAEVIERLVADGLSPDQIARLSSPIGIPSLHGRAPETIAVSVAAQLLQVLEADEAEAGSS